MTDRDGNVIEVGSRVLIVDRDDLCCGWIGTVVNTGKPFFRVSVGPPHGPLLYFPASLALVAEDMLGDARSRRWLGDGRESVSTPAVTPGTTWGCARSAGRNRRRDDIQGMVGNQ